MSKETENKEANINIENSDNRFNENGRIKTSNSRGNSETSSQKEIEKKSNCGVCCCDDDCIKFLFIIATGFIRVAFFPNLIMIIGVYISYIKNEQCQAEIYQKMNLIAIISVIIIMLSGIENLEFCASSENKCCVIFITIYRILDKIFSFGLVLLLLIMVQYYYNSSVTWENCGSIKGWLTYTLVIMYIEVIINSIGFIILIIFLILLCFKDC